MIDDKLDNLIAHSHIINRQLYVVRDVNSERTYLECFEKTQKRLRDGNYEHVANLFLCLHCDYELHRLEHPFSKPKYKTHSELLDSYGDWIEGNTLHKR
ncbi:MAG: hypothetical protein WCL18_10765 [bacterium]